MIAVEKEIPMVRPCPVCFANREFALEDSCDPERHRVFESDASFSGPGKDRSVQDTYYFHVSGQPPVRVHIFPLCTTCCGTGVVVNSDEFVQLQAETAMAMDTLHEIMDKYRHDLRALRERSDRITRVMIPFIIRKALKVVKRPAKDSYARYILNIMAPASDRT